jgi:putative lipase involved disintegration of autophagic bodies
MEDAGDGETAMTENHVVTPHQNERVSMRDYVDVRFESICKEIETANRVLDTRLEAMNEFRSAITDQALTFMTKNEYSSAHKPVEEDIKELRDFMAKQRGSATQSQVFIAYALGLLGILAGFLGHFLK